MLQFSILKFLRIIVVFLLFGSICYGQQDGGISVVATEKTKQEILTSGQGVEINGIVWATSDVGMRGSFVLHSKENGKRYDTSDYDVCPDGWRLPTKEEFENLIKNPQELMSDGVFIGVAPNKIFLPFDKNGSVNYWSGSYKMCEKLIIRRPFKCRYYLSIGSDFAPEVYDGAMKEQMKCRCVLDTVN